MPGVCGLPTPSELSGCSLGGGKHGGSERLRLEAGERSGQAQGGWDGPRVRLARILSPRAAGAAVHRSVVLGKPRGGGAEQCQRGHVGPPGPTGKVRAPQRGQRRTPCLCAQGLRGQEGGHASQGSEEEPNTGGPPGGLDRGGGQGAQGRAQLEANARMLSDGHRVTIWWSLAARQGPPLPIGFRRGQRATTLVT